MRVRPGAKTRRGRVAGLPDGPRKRRSAADPDAFDPVSTWWPTLRPTRYAATGKHATHDARRAQSPRGDEMRYDVRSDAVWILRVWHSRDSR
jgi:hypothetical protein